METSIERIERLIKEHGITKRSLAQKLNIPESTMFSWFVKTSPKTMKDRTIQMFADYFGVTFDYLKTGADLIEDTNGNGMAKIPSYDKDNKLSIINCPLDFFTEKRIRSTDCKNYIYKGTDLEPYIKSGDSLLLDCTEPTFEAKALYAIFFSEYDFTVRKINKNYFTNSISLYNLDGSLDCTLTIEEYKNKAVRTCRVLGLWRNFV